MDRETREQELKTLIHEYVEDRKQSLTQEQTKYTQNRYTTLELECRFGTKGTRIERNDYRQIVERLKSLGWKFQTEQYYLRISPDYTDIKTGKTKQSNIRVEVQRPNAIQEYCRSNTIDLGKTSFVQKQGVRQEDKFMTVEYPDFGFRVALSTERTISKRSRVVEGLLQSWNDKKKVYRLIQRNTFHHPNSNFQIDLSIVRTSKIVNRRMVKANTVGESQVMTNPEMVELECEAIDDAMRRVVDRDDADAFIMSDFKRTMKHCLSAIQASNYPISVEEQQKVALEYMRLMHKDPKPPRTKDFCGPSSISLELKNIQPVNDDSDTPTIRSPYTVTDKADGMRKLLFIDGNGRLYLIDTNMRIQFTGAVTKNVKLLNTLMDGEHILHDKKGNFINLYASFDIYFIQGKDMRKYGFMAVDNKKDKLRYPFLLSVVKALNLEGVNKTTSPIRVESKTFYSSIGTEGTSSIFEQCRNLLMKIDRGEMEYETDGLIFTPMNTGVGMDTVGKEPSNTKRTWMRSFKWKPPEYNTIDFMVTFNKDENGSDMIQSTFQDGNGYTSILQYKTATLRVGFDENVHGYVDPCQRLMENDFPRKQSTRDEYGSDYKPVAFVPSEPYDPNASVCHLPLMRRMMDMVIETKESEVIEDNTIVEFAYDPAKPVGWRWVPLRVRFDKTTELRRGERNYGNAYHVAESVWRSIHHPVTKEMISTGSGIPEIESGDVTAMDNFRGYIQDTLMRGIQEGQTLYDMNCGNAGDLPKWIHHKLKFVFGTDMNRDLLYHRIRGACAKYLDYHKQYRVIPSVLFAQADLTRPWSESFYTEKGKQMSQAIFGVGSKDRRMLGEAIYSAYGVVQDGFDMVSHSRVDWFFKSQERLTNFAQTLNRVCKTGGYFVGSMLDGEQVFEMLEDIAEDGVAGGPQWQIVKKYDSAVLNVDESSLGQEIHVKESVDSETRKTYLANMEYFERVMENHGFVLIDRTKSKDFGLPQGSNMYPVLYKRMVTDSKKSKAIATRHELALSMSVEDKKYMNLSRYFVFQKRNGVASSSSSGSSSGSSSDSSSSSSGSSSGSSSSSSGSSSGSSAE